MFSLSSFPPYPNGKSPIETIPLPTDLPAPAARFYQQICQPIYQQGAGGKLPIIHSAVITGRGKLRFKGIPFEARWRFTHCAGQGYRHYIEAAILGYPLLKVNEGYVDGHSRFELPFGVIEDDPNTTSAANIALWAESIWLPSIWLTDRRVRWEPVDDTTAKLIVPAKDGEESITATFDPATGLVQRLDAMRFRDATDKQKLPWRNEVYDWKPFNGVCVPSRASVTWLDQGTPWFELAVEDVVYNVDVSEYLYARGL